jgi:hypothetical protein
MRFIAVHTQNPLSLLRESGSFAKRRERFANVFKRTQLHKTRSPFVGRLVVSCEDPCFAIHDTRSVLRDVLFAASTGLIHREQEPSIAWRALEQARIRDELINEKNSPH